MFVRRRPLLPDPLHEGEQVFNADNPTVDLTPVSDAPAEAVKAGWLPVLSGQEIPLIWERRD